MGKSKVERAKARSGLAQPASQQLTPRRRRHRFRGRVRIAVHLFEGREEDRHLAAAGGPGRARREGEEGDDRRPSMS